MALNTEAKRWGMLGLASGPSAYSHVINPSGSNFNTQVERLTLLKVYGGDLAADSTAPVLSDPTGTATGATTATGTVTTDEAGTLYFLASTNSSESAGTIKAGQSQAATTGVQNVSLTGLTPETTYYLHYVEDDAAANESNVVSSAGFVTEAEPVEEIPIPRESVMGGATAYPSRKYFKDRRKLKAIEEDDAELIAMVKAALPQLLKHIH